MSRATCYGNIKNQPNLYCLLANGIITTVYLMLNTRSGRCVFSQVYTTYYFLVHYFLSKFHIVFFIALL